MKKHLAQSDVFEQLGFNQAESATLRLRSQMMDRLIAEIEKRKWTQAVAAQRLGVSQPRVSDLMQGKLHLFSVDMLITLLTALGLDVAVKVSRRAA